MIGVSTCAAETYRLQGMASASLVFPATRQESGFRRPAADNKPMLCASCSARGFPALARAAAKSAAARLRRLGALPVARDWPARLTVCESCVLRVVRNGVRYCGRPFLENLTRDPVYDGCGCPCREKAKSPAEHCPLDIHNRPAAKRGQSPWASRRCARCPGRCSDP